MLDDRVRPKEPDNLVQNFSLRYTGKLLLRNEIHIDNDLFEQFLHRDYFQSIHSITTQRFTSTCIRCGNNQKHLFGEMPCYLCNQTHLYCRKCIKMGRVSECKPLYMWTGEQPEWPQHNNPCSWSGELTRAQQTAANRITDAIRMKENELLIWAVCGSGKTEMLFPGITEALKLRKRICIATPRADVVRELVPRLKQAFANIHIQGLYGGSRDNDGTAQLIIATTHQLLRYKEAFDLMIIDEIDAFPFHADPSLPFATNRARKSNCTTIYLTATPRKNHQTLINQRKLPHIFVPVRYHNHPLPVPKMKMSFSLQKDFQRNESPKTFLLWMKSRKKSTRQLLVFVPTISLAEKIKDHLTKILVQEKIIKNHTSIISVHSEDRERLEKVELFRKKLVSVLITTTILERGVTFPSVDIAVLHAGHDVFDEAALIQIAGRAGRSAEDPTGEVIFFHDGKTKAMAQAIREIKQMNKRGGF